MPFQPGVEPPSTAEPRVWFLVHRRGLVVREQGASLSLPTAAAVDVNDAHYLGVLNGAHAFTAPFEGDPPAGHVLRDLRMLFGSVPDETFAVAGRAAHVIDWATTHRFCGRCGTPTEREPSERAMRCPRCKLSVYPRIAPAVIGLVRRGDQALLARGARFPLPFYSTLAGFSEVGESLEETFAREVREEVGVEVENIRYFGSQPWPFPHSLMIGFFADWASGDIRVDEKEILDAQWFSADALPMIPPPLSIARQLIDAWVADVR